jgi:hypothetical protein
MTPTRDGEWVKARYDNNPVGRIRQSCFETVVSLIGAMFTSHFRLREVVIRRNVPGGGFGVPCRIDLQRSRRESSPMTKTRDSVAGPAPTEPPLRLTQLSRARRRGKVARIEIRGGIPRRAIFETSLTGEGTTGEIAH